MTTPVPAPALPPQGPSPTRPVWRREVPGDDFRDHLSTADAEGRRQWLYPKKPQGRFYTARKWLSYLLLAIMFAGPFLRLDGNPLLLVNVVERKFSVLGRIFWPQDSAIFALAVLLFLTGIIVFTAVLGRLWCGWACPQTVLMELVFRRLEYWIEGDAARQRALAMAPWSPRKLLRKGFKHAVFLGLSFVIGNTLLAYTMGSEPWFRLITDDPREHLQGLTFMVLFTLVFYALFARFREQACTFICPYGRFQSTLIDEHTIVVAYDHKRGEVRGHQHRGESFAERARCGLGDCVDCHACVAVCPTGIDIRHGTQMECVHCTACIDACDAIMERTGRPRGLIRYASLAGVERGEPLRVTPRLIGYLAVLIGLGLVLGALLLTRSDIDATLLRAPGALFQEAPDGKISNLYQLKLVNKTSHDIPVELRLEHADAQLTVIGGHPLVPAQKLRQASVLIEFPPGKLTAATTPLTVSVYAQGRPVSRLKTIFVGPRPDASSR